MGLLSTQLYVLLSSCSTSRCKEMVVLSSGMLMEESNPDPLYQERVTCATFVTEHSNTHLELGGVSDDEGFDGE